MKIFSVLTILFSLNLAFAQSDIDKAIKDAKKISNEGQAPVVEPSAPQATDSKVQSLPSDAPAMVDKKIEGSTMPKDATKTRMLTKEESDMLKRRYRSLKDRPDLAPKTSNPDLIYDPAPVHNQKGLLQNEDSVRNAFQKERDSQLILNEYISYKDSFNVQICYTNGLSLVFDDSVRTTIQSAITDDTQYIGAIVQENKRGAYIHLKDPVPDGQYWESAVRLVRKSDDKTYLVNIIARACPKGEMNPFPRIIYLKDKDSSQPVISKKNSLLTPQDKVITKSLGYPKVSSKRINVYDMVASSGSEWVVFGIEIQMPNNNSETMDIAKLKFNFLDNLQINNIDAQIEYLPIPSEKISKMRGVTTLRFKASVNINKNYIMNDRYLHFMLVDMTEKNYQYTRIDVLPYFKSLMKRGLDL